MSDSLADLILTLTPEDGSSIGNGAMLALLREHMPSLSSDYVGARDLLLGEGISVAEDAGEVDQYSGSSNRRWMKMRMVRKIWMTTRTGSN